MPYSCPRCGAALIAVSHCIKCNHVINSMEWRIIEARHQDSFNYPECPRCGERYAGDSCRNCGHCVVCGD